VDVLTGLPFESNTGKMTENEKKEAFIAYVNDLGVQEKAELFLEIQYIEAIAKQLEPSTDAMLENFKSEDEIIAIISRMLTESTDMTQEQIADMFEGLSLEDLKTMIRPSIEQMLIDGFDLPDGTPVPGIKEQTKQAINAIYPTDEEKANTLTASLAIYTDAQFVTYYDELTEFSPNTYDETLVKIGCLDLDSPSAINLYASSFENKDFIVDMIAGYNDSVDESKKIAYTDYLGLMMSSITTIINAITYVLIAFVSISLVVSSIMIGVITLISVQERTKEIGILRAIGASKKNVSSMFNAETMIIGLASGILGVVVTYLLCIPINFILHKLTGISNLNAILPFPAALILVAISVALTLISGLIPSRSAAKKDPVIALRTE